MEKQMPEFSAKRVTIFGAAGGFVATWAVTLLLVLSETELGFPEGTFYAVMGMVLGMSGLNAVYLGFGLHLLVGTAIGTVAASLINYFRLSCLVCTYRYTGVGLIVGFIAWAVLFLPITIFGVEPILHEIAASASLTADRMILIEEIQQMVNVILLSAIVYHIIYGAIFGYVTSMLSRKMAVKEDVATNTM